MNLRMKHTFFIVADCLPNLIENVNERNVSQMNKSFTV